MSAAGGVAAKELEAALLGAVLDADGPVVRSHAGALLDVAGLTAEDFLDARVRVAWGVAARLAARRRPVDAMAVYAAGKATRAFGDGDLAWLQGLQTGNTLDRERFADVVESLRGLARARRLAQALEAAQAALRERPDVGPVVGPLEVALREVVAVGAPDGTGAEDVVELADDWQRREEGSAPPALVPTGLQPLDDVIGGLPVNLTVIAGLPSSGKSALLASMVERQLVAGVKVGLVGLEDGTKWLARRLVAREMGWPVRDVGNRRRTTEEALRFQEVASAASRLLEGLTTYRWDSITTEELCRRAASWVSKGVGAIYVDHGGEVTHGDGEGRWDEYRLRVAESYRRWRNLALTLQVPVVVLVHTARPSDDNEERPPRLSEVAESAYIERRARLLLGVWRRFSEADAVRVSVLKQTEGPANVHVRLGRHTAAALVRHDDGEVVDLAAEKAREARARREAKEAESAALRAQREAAKAAKKPARGRQLALGGDE